MSQLALSLADCIECSAMQVATGPAIQQANHPAAAHLAFAWQHQHPGMHKLGASCIKLLLRAIIWLLLLLVLLLLNPRAVAGLCGWV
jgi:hypothetical protein